MVKKTLMLIDGHSLAYRAFHALPADLSSPSGEPTNASFGFTTMLLTVLEAETPEYVIVCFDKGPSFRRDVYEAYKAHREKMPDEMRAQMSRIRELVTAFGFPIVELEDYEADDLLGTLARQAEDAGLDVLIVTGDRDALQLVDDRVTVLTSGRRFSDTIHYTPKSVMDRYGLTPDQLVDHKALVGDRSDNIPGVRGVGDKGATNLLQEYGTLDRIYDHVEELSTRYRNALTAGRDDAYLSLELGRIVRDAPVELDLAHARLTDEYDRDRLLRLMRQLGFRTLIQRLPGTMPISSQTPGSQLSMFDATASADPGEPLGRYRLVDSESGLQALCAELADADVLALDTETTSVDPVTADLVGLSLSCKAGEAWYVPVLAPNGAETLTVDLVAKHLGPLLSSPKLTKVGHNIKYDMKVLAQAGMPVRGRLFDTMVAEWVLNPDAALGLKSQAWTRLGVQMTEITELIGTGRSQITMAEVPIGKAMPYAAADADMTYRLWAQLESELRDREQDALFRDLEMPLLPVLADMELTGINVDESWLLALSRELANRLSELEFSITQHAGRALNINSTQQLSEVLFSKLGLPTRGIRKTKTGHYSTAAGVLERLRGKHPIVDEILVYRELSKLKSTYVDALPELINPATGRIHTSYNPTGTVTGRISSTNPNLQNIPIRSEEGRRIRRAFVAEEGWALVGVDYSQVELRIVAHVSGDAGLIEAFERDEDIHATTASAVYGVPLDEVSYEMRSIAKAVNFGLIYGQGAYGLSRQLGISMDEASDFISRYFLRFPGVRTYMDRTKAEAAERGYVQTLLKRRRYFPELKAGSRASSRSRRAAERMAINTPIQGSAADIIKLAMIRMHARLREQGYHARMLLQVHDEVVLEVPEDELQEAIALVKGTMENAVELSVPLKADVETGTNWMEMH